MTQTETASERLAVGDRAREMLRSGVPAGEIARRAGVSLTSIRKSIWLAEVFSPTARAALGECLDELGPSHLEVVAAVKDDRLRAALVTAAAAERLPVRELRRRVGAMTPAAVPAGPGSLQPVSCFGGPVELSRAQRAMERYSGFTDAQLDRLLAGPAGPTVRGLTQAAQALADRMDTRTPAA